MRRGRTGADPCGPGTVFDLVPSAPNPLARPLQGLVDAGLLQAGQPGGGLGIGQGPGAARRAHALPAEHFGYKPRPARPVSGAQGRGEGSFSGGDRNH